MGYKSDAQRKAVHASKNEAAGKMKHGSHAKMYDAPGKMSKELTYGGPVIDQMGNALSHMGAMKVLKHSKSRI